MGRLTIEQAYAARELHRDGIWSGRIAELLDADERDVLRVLSGREIEEPDPEPLPVPPVLPKAKPVDPNAWPPPVDERTEWGTVRVRGAYGQQPTEVRVRWVMLWGKRVRINDAAEVWCHCCLRFRTTQELSHPFNGHPVGLPHRGGIVAVSGEQMAEDDARLERFQTPRMRDLMREPM